ncbi:hypothetical protein F511_06989 [Dorcoceras hygrometricum]|uniref:Uncharacterized protein n=1 Tax=Dorcoceras hygrometricum TaxID=472368 RepID=A0A2Z7AW26_9LAMI|nr:hypothetical protein F511_06989 [Dorcoceras hygrometricum]
MIRRRNSRNLTTETIFCSQQNHQQPSDVAFTHQNDTASTNQNDAASLQQLTTDSFQNNQQLVTLNNSNNVVRDTSPLLPTAEQKRYTQNAAFQLIKTTSPLISDWFLKPTAGHSAGIIPHNATADSATIQQSTPKRLTNTCSSLILAPVRQLPADTSSNTTTEYRNDDASHNRYSTIDLC